MIVHVALIQIYLQSQIHIQDHSDLKFTMLQKAIVFHQLSLVHLREYLRRLLEVKVNQIFNYLFLDDDYDTLHTTQW